MVGLHTCGDLAPSTLRMFAAKPELAAVCSVGCCYHLLSEEFDPARGGKRDGTHTRPREEKKKNLQLIDEAPLFLNVIFFALYYIVVLQ